MRTRRDDRENRETTRIQSTYRIVSIKDLAGLLAEGLRERSEFDVGEETILTF